jgi:hypothetical protein
MQLQWGFWTIFLDMMGVGKREEGVQRRKLFTFFFFLTRNVTRITTKQILKTDEPPNLEHHDLHRTSLTLLPWRQHYRH